MIVLKKNLILNLSALSFNEPPKISWSNSTYVTTLLGNEGPLIIASVVAFKELCDRYGPASPIAPHFFSWISGIYDYPWIAFQYRTMKDYIAKYKLGKIQTPEFLDKILEIFSFIKAADISAEDLHRINKKRNELLSCRDVTSELYMPIDKTIIAKALLEEAWLARFHFSEIMGTNIKLAFSEREQICIISNSNPLDIWANVLFLKQQLSDIRWHEDLCEILTKQKGILSTGVPLDQDKKIILYSSYLHGAAKTGYMPDTNTTTEKTLLKILHDDLKLDPKRTELVSQWAGDRNQGEKQGYTVFSPEQYFGSAEFNRTFTKQL